MLIEVVANCLYYNPALALDGLFQQNLMKDAFSTWFSLLEKDTIRLHFLKISIIGLTSLFQVPFANWPSDTQGFLPFLHILTCLL